MSLCNKMQERIIEEANYIITTKHTIRATAKAFNISKSTIYLDVTSRLFSINKDLYYEVRQVLEFNKKWRYSRGGKACQIRKREKSLNN
ncbi:sporulation transcriptional regulator SpoIIID [Clostridium sporogenes]|uniref:Stage III sporulation D family protein n=3 Tax=Clostridium TaxID=1485 RepID=A0A1J1CRH2_CLOSG|nr:sporulation transcriptional regulator SpoIIID [Clostridium sporogenes]BAO05051.1 stage III sporulation protein D [Clostridium botulinum B str. Osaka05]APF25118.1 stage III sporulation D family protein [Clostridium sporogenes]APH17173.1 stage III sporulation D family protein [Clostridium sporogenes]KOY66072.1 stage III sporulation protein D [Clostridium sporogenes]MDS1006508.1 sporulation transcriptional regulator SpoIIID [Clostridium sporogenes]